MNVTIEKLPECRAKISAEVPAETVEGVRDGVINAFMNQAKLPGFRPGKLPRKVVENKFKSGIEDEMKERLVRSILQEAYKKEDLEILGVAETERAVFESDGTFTYASEVVTRPEVELTEEDYKNIPVEVEKVEITDEMVGEFLERVQRNFAEFKETDQAAKRGDKVGITYTATKDGAPLADSLKEEARVLAHKEEPFDLDVPMEGQDPGFEMIPGLGEKLVGAKAGEELEVEVDFGEEHFVPELAGVQATYAVKVENVLEAVLPEIDDALAQRSGSESLEQLEEQYRGNMAARIEQARTNHIEQQILTHLNREHEFELPKEQVFQETQYQVNQMVSNAVQQGMPMEEIDEHEKDIVESASNRAVANLRTRYLLMEIAGKEGIEVNDDELTQQVFYMAQQQNKPVRKLARELRDGPGFDNVRADILIGKTIAFLKENASVKEVDPTPEEEAPEKE